jgi:large subunit ribosomal protein L3
VGITKGKGFAGAVKRYHFRGQPKSRGHDHVRAVGSIGSRWPQRTLPGKKMAGQMGNEQRTLQNLVIVDIDVEKKLIYIKGSVTGANKSLLKIAKTIKHVS